MRDIVLELLSSYGYAGMFALILIENLFPPIPSRSDSDIRRIYDNVHTDVNRRGCPGSNIRIGTWSTDFV